MFTKTGSIRSGFMEVVVCCDSSNKLFLVIRSVNLLSTVDTLLFDNRTFRYTSILYGTHSETALETIDLESLLEKLVFRLEINVNFSSELDSIFFL